MEEYLQLLDETGEARRDGGASDLMQQNTPAAASAGVEEQYITQEKKVPPELRGSTLTGRPRLQSSLRPQRTILI